ncbi:hypothetical protein WG66_010875 [Moniliophthora roreri]|nr:hypothetical protein WG66_010875 [Moniliophthora roreri]
MIIASQDAVKWDSNANTCSAFAPEIFGKIIDNIRFCTPAMSAEILGKTAMDLKLTTDFQQ